MSATTSFEELIKQQMKRLRRWNYNSSPKRGKTPESYNHTQILEIQYLVNNLLKFIKIIKHATALTNGGLSKRERKAEELLTDVMQNIQHIRERLLRCQQKVSTTKVHAKEIQLKRQQRELTNMIESLRTGNTKNLTRFAINSSEAIKYRIQRLGSKGKDSGLLQTDMSDLATKMDDIVDIIKDFKSVTDCGSSSDISLFTRRVASMCGENSSASQGILGLMEVRQAEMTQESSVDRSSSEQKKKNFSNLANAAAKPTVSRKSREEQFLDRDEPNKTIQCLACGNADSSLVFGDWPMYSEGSSLMPVASAANNNSSPYEKLATVAERFGFSSGDFFGDRANENQNRTAEGEFSLITSVVPTRAKESLRKRRKNERKEASVVEAPESKLGQSSETKGRTPVLTSMLSADSEKQTSVLPSDTSQSADGLLTMSSTSSVNTQISSTTTLVSSEISTNSSRTQLMSSVTKERILTTCITSSADKQTQSSPLVLSSANKHSQSSPLLSSANKHSQSSPLLSPANKHSQSSPLLSSANKQTQSSPLILSSANKQTQSSPLVLSSANKQTQSSSLVLSSANKQTQSSPLVLSSADKQIQLSPLLSSADKQIQLSPLLSSADKQIQSSPLLSSANKQIQSSPLLPTANKQIESSPLLSSDNKQIQSSPLLSSANKQIQSSPLLSSANKQIQSPPLLSSANKQIQSSPLLSSANKQIQSSPLLSSADKQIQSSPLLSSADTHIQSTTPTLSSATKQTQSSTPLQSHDDKESSSIAHLASSVMKENSSSSLSSSCATSSVLKADSSRTSQLSFATNDNNDDDDNNTSATPSVHVGDVDDVWMLDDFGRLETFSAEAEERIERLRKLIEFPDLDNSSDAHVEAVAERVGEVAKTSHVKPTRFRTLATTVVVLLVIFAVACCCVESSSGFLYRMMSLVVQINPHGGEFY